MSFNLQIVRHGKTEAVPRAIYCGYSDLPLNQEGIEEIQSFIDKQMYRPAQLYYSSGLKRALETLQLIAPGVIWTEITELKECNFGDFELRTHAELLSELAYNNWINDTEGNYIIPGGESTQLFNLRVLRGFEYLFDDIAKKKADSALLTTHGGVIAHFIKHYYDPNMNLYEAMPSHGRGYDVDIDVFNGKVQIIDIKKI